MKITFDVQLLMKGEKTGISWCAENILTNMTKYQQDLNLNIFTLKYNQSQLQEVLKYSRLGYQINQCKWFHDVLYRLIWNLIPFPYHWFFKEESDVTVFFNYVIPPGVKGHKIAFVYDMAYKACPDTVRFKTKNMLKLYLRKSISRADKIITISEFSKSEIIHYMGIDKDKIAVMPCGVDYSLYHENYSEHEVSTVLKKYRINKPYMLYLGTLEPRKNITRLLQAYSQLRKKRTELPLLVLAGRKGWLYDSIFETVKELGLENNVVFTGYIEATDSPLLMKGAEMFLFPSIYEGFGMPPLEAMACGTPVVVSNVSSLPEVVGDAGIMVDPYSINSITAGIEKLMDDNDYKDLMIQRGLNRVRQFSWERSAKIVNDIIQTMDY